MSIHEALSSLQKILREREPHTLEGFQYASKINLNGFNTFETMLKTEIPEPLKQLYHYFNGMAPGTAISETWRILPIEEMARITLTYRGTYFRSEDERRFIPDYEITQFNTDMFIYAVQTTHSNEHQQKAVFHAPDGYFYIEPYLQAEKPFLLWFQELENLIAA